MKAYDGEELMHIKGSGWDLDSIEAPGLPAVRLAPLLAARIKGERLPDPDMVALLRANLMEQDAPNPSVEALLHAFLPFAYVDHSHATAILARPTRPLAECSPAITPSVKKCSARSVLSFASSRPMTWCVWPKVLNANSR